MDPIDAAKVLLKQLPDPESCEAFDYLNYLNKLLQDYIEKFGAGSDALRSLKTEVILPLDRDEIIIPRLKSVINSYRDKTVTDVSVIRGFIDIYFLLERSLYDLEEQYSAATIAYYKSEFNTTSKYISSIHKILLLVNIAVKSEEELGKKINLPAELLQNVTQNLIEALLKDISDLEEYETLVHEKQHDTLKLLFQLRKLSNNFEPLLSLWQRSIQFKGQTFFANEPTMEVYLNMKKDYDYMAKECFEGHEDFANVFQSTMLKLGSSVIPILCVEYADRQLRANIEHPQSNEELSSWMDRVVELIPDSGSERLREWFSLYEEYFRLRVISHKQLAIEAERLMMSKIPSMNPTNYLMCLGEDMEEIRKKFKEYLAKEQIKFSIDFEITLLYSSWKSSLHPNVHLNYPEQLKEFQDVFASFFHYQLGRAAPDHGSRRLYWTYPQHSTCVVVGNFTKGSKQLFVSLEQTIVLLLFNDDDTLTFEEIAGKTGIKEENLLLVLLPLARSGILVKQSTPNFIAKTDTFSFGEDFSSIRPGFDFTPCVTQSVSAQLNQERRLKIDAAIVRIMKRRQTMPRDELLSEVYAALAPRFLTRLCDINREIGGLIEREYIRYSPTERKVLEYVP